jgi:hypothetical protein
MQTSKYNATGDLMMNRGKEEIRDLTGQLMAMTGDSEIIIKIDQLQYILNPISTGLYIAYRDKMDYLQQDEDAIKNKSTSKEIEIQCWLISQCTKDPKMTPDEVSRLPVGIFIALFSNLMSCSFLLPKNMIGSSIMLENEKI